MNLSSEICLQKFYKKSSKKEKSDRNQYRFFFSFPFFFLFFFSCDVIFLSFLKLRTTTIFINKQHLHWMQVKVYLPACGYCECASFFELNEANIGFPNLCFASTSCGLQKLQTDSSVRGCSKQSRLLSLDKQKY